MGEAGHVVGTETSFEETRSPTSSFFFVVSGSYLLPPLPRPLRPKVGESTHTTPTPFCRFAGTSSLQGKGPGRRRDLALTR